MRVVQHRKDLYKDNVIGKGKHRKDFYKSVIKNLDMPIILYIFVIGYRNNF